MFLYILNLMKKSLKITLAVLLCIMAATLAAIAAYFAVTADAKLDRAKLVNYGQSINFFDDAGNKIESAAVENSRISVSADELSAHTKNAFIASEDKTFYSHHGLNYGRMAKALIKNIASFSFKEGASTISQQLIKNTHLSNDKTVKRKLKEIRLTKQLERAYSKDEILEMYLNTIYFGHSCYGLQSAAHFYFGKNAEDLDLNESATLAGLLSSPNNYSPFKDAEKCKKRRDMVLRRMLDCSFITDEQYVETCTERIETTAGGTTRSGSYIKAACNELDALGLDSYRDLSGCSVHTYMDAAAQRQVDSTAYEHDCAIMVTNAENGVSAYMTTIDGAARQPGSAIKPLLVYAPAIEEGLVHTFTKIDDCPINYGGYAPENHDKKFHGAVTVAESLAKSYNIPAVKVLNMLTAERAAEYAEKLNIDLEDGDKNLSLALGGMKYGCNIKVLCDAYTVFRQQGVYTPSTFIKYITDRNGKIIYRSPHDKKRVFDPGTCSLMNEMLTAAAETGTAKKLRHCAYDIAAKTGTCGDESGNTDAYAIAYTSTHTVCVWQGDANNKRTDITGGGTCCGALKDIADMLYRDKKPDKLQTGQGTSEIYIDRQDYEESGKIILADEIAPKLCKLRVSCLKGREPAEKSSRFSSPVIRQPKLSTDADSVCIELCKTKYYSYLIKCDNDIVYDGPYRQKITHTPGSGSHLYSVTPYYTHGDKKYSGRCLTLGQINLSTRTKELLPPIADTDWYNR